MLFTACIPPNKLLIKNKVEGTDLSYKINYHPDCCGCGGYYFNIYEKAKLKEQFVCETQCSFDEPTKNVFRFKKNGRFDHMEQYIAVFDSSYTIPLTSTEKKVMLQLDSLLKENNKPARQLRNIQFYKITGYRKAKKEEHPHYPFLQNKEFKED